MAIVLHDLPDSELRFHFKGGRLCLDFAATVGERWRRSFERLRAPADLGRWLVEAGLLPAPPRVSREQLEQARDLREAIYRLAKRAGSGTVRVADVDLVNRWAERPPLAPRLAADGNSTEPATRRPVEGCLATIARDAIDLLSSPLAARVRECAADDCALLFVDVSRGGRRRWCSMQACGNRAKARGFRERARGEGALA